MSNDSSPPDNLEGAVEQPTNGEGNGSSRIIDLPIEDELKKSYLTYAMSVIVSRALPDVRDGLKPSQRRILVAMNDLNLGPGSARTKCSKIAGETMGNYHPHGDQAIYPTLVRLAQEWVMRHVLIDKQGNFGSIAGLPPAAMRYTEARLSSIATMMLDDLKLDTVDFVPTYDERHTEPTVLPSRFPNLLVNGSTGIAVGMATSIPPHNLREICDALIRVIDDSEVSIERDRWGIPHIYADHDTDLFFAFGYAMAQDRLFQLDYLRRKGLGRLSEILGSDGLQFDTIARTVGINRIAVAEVERLSADVRQSLESFSAGVNMSGVSGNGNFRPIGAADTWNSTWFMIAGLCLACNPAAAPSRF